MSRTRISITVVAALVVALLFPLIDSPPAHAAFAGKNGGVVFTSDRPPGLGYELYTKLPNTNVVQNLTTAKGDDTEPAVDPTGRWVAFTSTQDLQEEIYVLDLSGIAKPVRVTKNQGFDSQAAWSPDGARLVFSSVRNGEPDRELYVQALDKNKAPVGAALKITDNAAHDSAPTWAKSGSGQKIAWVSAAVGPPNPTGDFEIVTAPVAPDGTPTAAPTWLTQNTVEDNNPNWHPAGTHLVYQSALGGDNEIWTMQANGALQTQRTNNAANDRAPSYSPDGTMVVFTRAPFHIMLLNLQSTAPPTVYDASDWNNNQPDWGPIPACSSTVQITGVSSTSIAATVSLKAPAGTTSVSVTLKDPANPADTHTGNASQAQPQSSWSVNVANLTPGVIYDVTATATACSGAHFSSIKAKTLRRSVTLGFDKLWMIDDSDDWPSGAADLELWIRLAGSSEADVTPSEVSVDTDTWFDPADVTVTVPNVPSATVEIAVAGTDDDCEPILCAGPPFTSPGFQWVQPPDSPPDLELANAFATVGVTQLGTSQHVLQTSTDDSLEFDGHLFVTVAEVAW